MTIEEAKIRPEKVKKTKTIQVGSNPTIGKLVLTLYDNCHVSYQYTGLPTHEVNLISIDNEIAKFFREIRNEEREDKIKFSKNYFTSNFEIHACDNNHIRISIDKEWMDVDPDFIDGETHSLYFIPIRHMNNGKVLCYIGHKNVYIKETDIHFCGQK